MDTETHHHHKGDDDMASQQQQQQQELPASGPRRSITRELPASESDHPPQPSEHLATSTDDTTLPRHPFSDEPPEITPDVRVAAPNSETAAVGSPSLGKEANRSTSVASRRADRGLPANGVGEGAFAAGAVTATNEPPANVDPDLQARAASVEEELVQMAAVGKEEERTFFSFLSFITPLFPISSTKLLTPLYYSLDAHTDGGVGRKLSKIEKRGAKVERTTLHLAIQELAEVQGLQKASIEVVNHFLFFFFFHSNSESPFLFLSRFFSW